MKFAIGLGDGKSVTARAYLAALRQAQANPTATFDRSFCGQWAATGAEIVREHYAMLHKRWAAWGATGKGNRAAKRAQAIRDARAVCKWCGQPTGEERKQFCEASCRQAYWG